MQRKTSKTPSRIWSFGAREPVTEAGRALLRDQLGGAFWYWNALTQIEKDRRAGIKTIELSVLSPEERAKADSIYTVAAEAMRNCKETDKDAREKEIKKIWAAAEAELATLPGFAKIREARKQRKALYEQLKAAKKAEDAQETERLRQALAAIPLTVEIDGENEKANTRVKEARAAARLHFGTYTLVNKAMEAARGTPEGPKFKRWNECSGMLRGTYTTMAEGRLGAHIVNGHKAAELSTNTMLQVDWPDLGAWKTKTRSERRKACRVMARIRADSDGKKPIWVEFPVVIHRPLPSDAIVKAAWLRCKYVGTRWEYEFQLQLESSSFVEAEPRGKNGAVAVDLCWRKRDNGIRVAYLCDENGARREMLMPSDILDDLNASYETKGNADLEFDKNRERLADDLGNLTLPPAHASRFAALRLWKSAQRLAEAITWWRHHRFEGDERAFDSAWTGLLRWRHLYQYHTGVRVKALARRKDYYENMALQICRDYGFVVIGDFDMRDVVELDKKAKDAPKGARHNRFAAAPAEFRQVLKATTTRLGGAIKVEDCSKATMTCAACDQEHELNPFEVEFRCTNCGVVWDRGHNHCTNLLKRASGSVPPKIPTPLAPMIPRVCAKPRSRVKVRDRSKKTRDARRSKKAIETPEISNDSIGAAENLAQEVRS